jgi:sulfoxide reductase heme-binding subunit YedZ
VKKRNTWILVLVVPAVFGLSLLVQRVAPVEGWQSWLVRSLALTGYLLVFLAALSSASLPVLAKAFGRPFIAVHHVATFAGFAAMVAHPLAYSVAFGSFEPLVPRVDSVAEFFLWAGRPALALFIVAVVAALLRVAFKKGWRFVHLVTYLAFILVTVHANLIGRTFQGSIAVRVASWIMAGAATALFVRKRVLRRRAAGPAAAPAAPSAPAT